MALAACRMPGSPVPPSALSPPPPDAVLPVFGVSLLVLKHPASKVVHDLSDLGRGVATDEQAPLQLDQLVASLPPPARCAAILSLSGPDSSQMRGRMHDDFRRSGRRSDQEPWNPWTRVADSEWEESASIQATVPARRARYASGHREFRAPDSRTAVYCVRT